MLSGSDTGLNALFSTASMSDVKVSWKTHERYKSVLVSKLVVAGIHAPTWNFEVACYEHVVGQIRSKMHMAPMIGGERFLIGGDFNLELVHA